MSDSEERTLRGGRRDGRAGVTREPGRTRRNQGNVNSGLTVTPAEKMLLRGIRDARRRLLGSGNQFDTDVASDLERAAKEWSDLTGLTFPTDEALDKD